MDKGRPFKGVFGDRIRAILVVGNCHVAFRSSGRSSGGPGDDNDAFTLMVGMDRATLVNRVGCMNNFESAGNAVA